MPKYEVTVQETVVYKVTVEAADEQAAGEAAKADVIEGGNEHFSHVEDRSVTDTREVP